MINWRRIALVLKALVAFMICGVATGGILAVADTVLGLALGEWLFASSVGKAVMIAITVVVFRTLFPSLTNDVFSMGADDE